MEENEHTRSIDGYRQILASMVTGLHPEIQEAIETLISDYELAFQEIKHEAREVGALGDAGYSDPAFVNGFLSGTLSAHQQMLNLPRIEARCEDYSCKRENHIFIDFEKALIVMQSIAMSILRSHDFDRGLASLDIRE